jgi:hypothetical protein
VEGKQRMLRNSYFFSLDHYILTKEKKPQLVFQVKTNNERKKVEIMIEIIFLYIYICTLIKKQIFFKNSEKGSHATLRKQINIYI